MSEDYANRPAYQASCHRLVQSTLTDISDFAKLVQLSRTADLFMLQPFSYASLWILSIKTKTTLASMKVANLRSSNAFNIARLEFPRK